MPFNKPKKVNAIDVFSNLSLMILADKDLKIAYANQKVLFYKLGTEYTLLLTSEQDGIVEVSSYNSETGKKTREELFSLESLFTDAEKKDKKNSIALIYDQKLWILNATKNWGMFGAMDLKTKKVLYNFRYDDKQEVDVLNFPPTMYETNPGAIMNLSKDKEKIKEISMNKFCTELYKYTLLLKVYEKKESYYTVELGNHDLKQFTSGGYDYGSGGNKYFSKISNQSFSNFYITTTAGLFIDKSTLKQSPKKSTWNEVNNKNVSTSYKKIENKDEDEECYSKRSMQLGYLSTSTAHYVIYFYDKNIKIREKLIKSSK